MAQTYLDGTDLSLSSSPANFKTRLNRFKMLRIARDHFLKRKLKPCCRAEDSERWEEATDFSKMASSAAGSWP
jgi:hypothetical protein